MGAVLDNSNLNEAQGWAASAVARQRNYFESGATRSYAFQRATGFRKYFAAEMFPSPRLGFAPRAALLQWPCRFLAIRH